MSAALGGQKDLVKKLIKLNADLELKNQVGDTALAVAVSNDQFSIADLLIKAGAKVDITVAGDEGDSLFMRAALGSKQTADLILAKDNSLLNKTNRLGETALMKCVLFGNNSMVRHLIKTGADTQIKNNGGLTAFDIAKSTNNDEALKLLSSKK
jgi:ankyrin repeat protein